MPVHSVIGRLIIPALLVIGMIVGLAIPSLLHALNGLVSSLASRADISPTELVLGMTAGISAAVMLLGMIWTIRHSSHRAISLWNEGCNSLQALHVRLNPYLARKEQDYSTPSSITVSEWAQEHGLSEESSDEEFARALALQLGAHSRAPESSLFSCVTAVIYLFTKQGQQEPAFAACERLANLSIANEPFPPPYELMKPGLHAEFDAYMANFRDRHGYETTVLVAMMLKARTRSRFPISALRWLADASPMLWAAVDNAGRTAVSPMALAIIGHHRVEAELGYAITKPAIDSALLSLRVWLSTYSLNVPGDDDF